MELATLAQHPDLARHAERLGDVDPNHLVVISYDVKAQVDKFGAASIAAARAHHHLDREPTGEELFAWARALNRGPDETVLDEGNLLTTAGLNRITALIIAGGGTAYDATHTRLGVGDANTAATIGDTDLGAAAGSTHRQWVTADATYPQQSNGVITVRATHTTGLSNFHWQEWAVDQGTANGTAVSAVMLNHKIVDLGTKTSASSWVFTVTITLA